MCGRFFLAAEPDALRTRVRATRFEDPSQRYRKSWNVGPTRTEPVLIAERRSDAGDPGPSSSPRSSGTKVERVLRCMKWGLIPSWSKEMPDFAATRNTINARDDTVSGSKSMWSSMKDKKRCVVPIQGFFEWQKMPADEKIKIPHLVTPAETRAGSPKEGDLPLLLCAGLYDIARLPDREDKSNKVEVYSFTIITTNNSKDLAFLHDRMPVILDESDVDLWLDPTVPFEKVRHLLRPREGLHVVPVTSFVSKIGQDSEECIRPGGEFPVNVSFHKLSHEIFAATADELRIMKLGKKALGNEKGLQSVASFFGAKPDGKAANAEGLESATQAVKRSADNLSDADGDIETAVADAEVPKREAKEPRSPAPAAPAKGKGLASPAPAKKAKSAAASPAKKPDPNQKSLTSFFGKKA
ncbi:hypothetical protein DFJ74DRAFT_314111 [Hyaloraphidium curvatum]|nr:hypothetical protein DFJ74DRAFT_314111 [Hyaloraphidium curvatum]